jgi:hypothetical protein
MNKTTKEKKEKEKEEKEKKKRTREINRERWWTNSEEDKQTLKGEKNNSWFRNN